MNNNNSQNSFLNHFIPWIIPSFVPIYLVFLPVIFSNYPTLALVTLLRDCKCHKSSSKIKNSKHRQKYISKKWQCPIEI